jgi:hypothetical protein
VKHSLVTKSPATIGRQGLGNPNHLSILEDEMIQMPQEE